MKILAYLTQKRGAEAQLSCSDGRVLVTNDWSGMVTFLLEPCEMAVTFRIDQFLDVIASVMPKETEKKLRAGGRCFLPDNTKLYYQPGRVVGITYVNEVNFYGLSRYTDDEITDVHVLAKLADDVIAAYAEMGLQATKLTSPVACYGDVLSKIPFPRACDLPYESLEMTEQCSKIMTREWREVYKIGHWEANEIWDADIRSAYPSLIAKLPDISEANFFQSDVMPETYSWGVLEGDLEITKRVSPLASEKEALITTDQLWLLDKYQIGKFKMARGWFYSIPGALMFPLRQTMVALFSARMAENALVARIAKGISVGVYGRFAQTFDDGKLGDDFNAIYAAMITSRCSVKDADFIYRRQLEDKVVSVMVDGCLIEGPRPDIAEDKRMGAWRVNEPSPALVLSVLYQWLADKHPNGEYYGDMMTMIKANPKASVYGDVDLNLIERGKFKDMPRTGGELLARKYER